MGILNLLVNPSTIPTPPAGKVHLFFDVADGQPKYRDSTGTINLLTGAVNSFNGRLGIVTPQQSDYDAFFIHKTANVVYVKTNPTTGEFSSIASAVASITTNSSSNPFLVEVGPGVYTESLITMKPYVYVVGSGQDITIIQTASSSQNAVELADNSFVGKLTITGATGSGFAAIHYASSTTTATTTTLVEDIHFGANNILINNVAQGSSHPSVILCNNIRFGGSNFFDKGFVATNNGSGVSIILIKSSSTAGGISGTFSEVGLADGVGCRIAVNGGSFRTVGGGGNGNGFVAQNGGILTLSSVIVNEFQKAIYLPNVGASTGVYVDSPNFFNNTIDVQIDHASAVGYVSGIPEHQKTIINASNSVYVVGKDAHIITVAKKGGDFTSIAAACASILDAGPFNPYLVSVDPGIYTEGLITIPSYVTITGGISSSDNLVVIEPSGSHHIITLGGAGCQLSYLTLRNTAVGYAGVAAIDSVDFAMDQISVEDCDIGVLHSTSTVNSEAKISHTDFSGIYTHALQITSTGGFISKVRVHGVTTFCDASNTGDDIVVDGTAASLEIEEANLNGSGLNIGVRVTNGGYFATKAFSVSNYTTGIIADSTGSNPVINLGVIIFNNISGLFINILNATASGYLNGAILNSQIFINPSSSWFVTGKDLQIVTVAKRGGDFTSIAAAVTSITDASSSKPYLISVGPGIFVESQITMKQFVYVRGSGRQSTFITANSVNQTTVVGIDNSGIANVAITGATGASGIGIYLEGAGTTIPFLIQNILFGSNFTQMSVFGNSAMTVALVEDCVMGGIYNFTSGFNITANTGIGTILLITNFILQDVIAPFPTGNIITAYGASVQVTLATAGFRIATPTGNGIVAYNGAQIQATNLTMRGFLKALYTQNTGVAPTVRALASTLSNNTVDIQIDHPTTIGGYFGAATGSKIFNSADDTFQLLFQDITNGSTVSSGTFKLRFPGNKETDVSTLIIEASTMGNSEGGNIYDLHDIYTGRVVGVTAGFGYLEIEPEILKKVGWPEDSILVPANAESFIYYDNTGTLTYSSTIPDTARNIYVGRVVTDTNSIVFIDDSGTKAEHTGNLYETMFSMAFGPIYASGSSVAEGSTPLTLNVQGGTYFFATNSYNPSGASPISFLECYNNSIHNTPVTIIKVKWDNTIDPYSTLVDPTAGYYLKHTLYVVGEGANEKYFLVYSQAQYATLLIAEGASIPIPPPEISNSVCLIASIIVQQGNANIVEIRDERPRIGFKASGTSSSSDHQALSNRDSLTAHSQYLLKANTDSMGIDLNMGGFSVVNVNLVDGVDVSAHAARHLPSGADPLTTAAPTTSLSATTANSTGSANSLSKSDHIHSILTGTVVQNLPDQANAQGSSANLARADHIHNIPSGVPVTIGTANAQGSAASFALSDHAHSHGNQTGPTQHAVATTIANGFLSAADKVSLNSLVTNAITSLNGLTGQPSQTFSTGTSGTDFNISSVVSNHVFNIPDASATARGLITTSSQTIAGTKTFSSTIAGSITGNAATATALQTARLINGVSFDGTANISVPVDIDGLTAVTFISANDELAVYSTADPYLPAANRKITFANVESHLSLSNLSGKLSIAKGGTNSTTPLNNNRFIISVGGEITEASAMTAGRVLLTDGAGLPEASAITEIQLDALSGISGNIQVLLNAKLSTSLGNSKIIVGNSSNIATEVALSGDAIIANTGALTITNGAITDAKVSPTAAIQNTKLAISANDGIKLNTGTGLFTLDIDGLTVTTFISANDEIAIYSTADPYLATDNRKITFSTLESHLNLSNLTGKLSINKGGTNSTTALSNNRIMISTGGEITEATAISSNVVIVSDASGLPKSSSITETQLNALSGISGNIQTLLNAKISTTLGNSHINVGNSSNIATEVAMSGDATIANTGSLTIANNAISNAKFRQSAGLSIIGNINVGSGNVADITATASNQVLRVNSTGTSIAFGTLNLASSSAVTGALPIVNGGTGQTTKQAAFDALSPLTTKGDIVVFNGTNNIRQGTVSDGQYLVSDSTQANGLKWNALDIDAQNADTTAGTTTTSVTMTDLTGTTLTTAGSNTKKYLITYSGTFSNSNNGRTISIQLVINGSAITNSVRSMLTASANQTITLSINYEVSIPVGQIVKIQWDTSANTATCANGALSMLGIV